MTTKTRKLRYTGCCLPYDIWLKNGFTKKKTSHGVAVAVHDVEGLHKAIGLYIAKNKPDLIAEEIRFLRKEMDLSQKDLAEIIMVGETSVRNWESRRGVIQKPAETILRLLYIESVKKDGSIRDLLEELSRLNRLDYQSTLEMKDTSSGWRLAA